MRRTGDCTLGSNPSLSAFHAANQYLYEKKYKVTDNMNKSFAALLFPCRFDVCFVYYFIGGTVEKVTDFFGW